MRCCLIPVKSNNRGAPLLGLAKSIYYYRLYPIMNFVLNKLTERLRCRKLLLCIQRRRNTLDFCEEDGEFQK